VVSRWELQRVNIQIIEHGGNWDLTVKFFKHQHGLSVVGIEFRAIFATVIGNTADVLCFFAIFLYSFGNVACRGKFGSVNIYKAPERLDFP